MTAHFSDRLIKAIEAKNSACVVGLDPILSQFPAWNPSLLDFGRVVIDAVHDLVPMIKPQSAYFEALGLSGLQALETLRVYAQQAGLLMLLDAKRGDIPSTASAYASAYLGTYDALTVNPYLGPDSLEPFVSACNENGSGLFVLAMTSNDGAGFLQKTAMASGEPLYLRVAEMVASLDQTEGERGYSSIGVVAGATYPEEAALLRQKLPSSFFLVPGIGAQGGDPSLLRGFFDAKGFGAVVNSSRAITYSHPGATSAKETTAAVREAALRFVDSVNAQRQQSG